MLQQVSLKKKMLQQGDTKNATDFTWRMSQTATLQHHHFWLILALPPRSGRD
jgi:hypothetical protein